MTTETNAERLMTIRENIEAGRAICEPADMEWLIQQAERTQKSEDALLSWVDAKEKIKRKHEIVSKDLLEEREKRFDAEVKAEKLEKENARLREALADMKRSFNAEFAPMMTHDAKVYLSSRIDAALKGESE